MSGSGLVEALPWETEHFGFGVARLTRVPDDDELRAAHAWCREASIRCLTLLLPHAVVDRLTVLQERGFRVVDLRTTLDVSLEPAAEVTPESVAVSAGDEVAEDLRAIARERFTLARFFADPRFPPDRSAALYEAWLDRALRGEGDRWVLADPAGRGFVAARHAMGEPVGVIELVGVATAGAGAGLGRRLVQAAHRRFAREGATGAEIVTQGANVPAMRTYEACGYRVSDAAFWLHSWPGADPAPAL